MVLRRKGLWGSASLVAEPQAGQTEADSHGEGGQLRTRRVQDVPNTTVLPRVADWTIWPAS